MSEYFLFNRPLREISSARPGLHLTDYFRVGPGLCPSILTRLLVDLSKDLINKQESVLRTSPPSWDFVVRTF